MATRMQQRRGTSSQWTTANPVMASGEIGFETDTNKLKIGDGVNVWANLSYFIDETNLSVSLGDYVELASVGVADGVASLDVNGFVPAAQLNIDVSGDIDAAISALVDAAPGALDTLNELAAAIGDDANFITTITDSIGTKQDKVTNVSDIEIGHLDGVTSGIQAQIDSKQNELTGLTATTAELNYLDGVTSAIQTQIDNPLASFITNAGTTRTITAAADSGKTIRFTSGSATVVTVNASTDLAVGARVDIIADGAGELTVAASGATIKAAEVSTTTGSFTIGTQYSAATLLCVATDEYRLIGNIAAV